jgi:energy coupling factor transporter S component ThiW
MKDWPLKNNKEEKIKIVSDKMAGVRRLVLTSLFAALAVLLSGVHFPVGPTKVFPFQHMVNTIAGILVGPWYGGLAALIAGIIRNAIGTGTPFAFPGGIPGAIVVGLAYRWFRRDWVAFTEPVGTGFIGVGLSVLVLGPLIGKEVAFAFLFPAFMVSSVPGSVIGYFLLKALRKTKVLELQQLPES